MNGWSYIESNYEEYRPWYGPISTESGVTITATGVTKGICLCKQETHVEMQEGFNADKSNVSNVENIGEAPIAEEDVSKGAAEGLQNPEEQEDESIYPDKFKLTLIVFGLNLSVFCVGLDNTTISTAIPKITDQFRALDDVGWYASSYLLTTCAFQLM